MKRTMNKDWHTLEKNKGYPLGLQQDKDPATLHHARMENTAYFVIFVVDLDINPHNVIPLTTGAPLHIKVNA